MAQQKIPLNKFRSKFLVIPNVLTEVYTAVFDRATILLNVQATNITAETQTVTLIVSAGGNPEGTLDPYIEGPNNRFAVVESLPIPPYDARTLVSGRLVLRGKDNNFQIPDKLLIQASNENSVHLSLGILEAVNKD